MRSTRMYSTEGGVPRSRRPRDATLEPLRMPGAVLTLLTEQVGLCALCADELVTPPNAPDELTGIVDRDPHTATVRGLLCRRCHEGVSLFGGDPELVQRVLAYLDPGRVATTSLRKAEG